MNDLINLGLYSWINILSGCFLFFYACSRLSVQRRALRSCSLYIYSLLVGASIAVIYKGVNGDVNGYSALLNLSITAYFIRAMIYRRRRKGQYGEI